MASLSTPKAILILRTDDLANNSTNDVGTCDQFNTNFTWRNINMKTLLGGMSNDYDDFSICLTQLGVGVPAASFGTANNDRTVDLFFSGLTLKNAGYSVLSQTNKQSVSLFSYVFNPGAITPTIANYNIDNTSFIFTNDADLVDINIKYTKSFKSYGNYDITTTTVFPQMVFNLRIVGIPREAAKNHEHLNLK